MKTKKEIESLGYSIKFTNGSGAGGQKRNRTLSVAVVTHIDSGFVERSDDTRSANKNMNIAYDRLVQRLLDEKNSKYLDKLNELRKTIKAKGVIRTYDFRRGIVKNHITKKEAPLKRVLNGDIESINK